MALFAVVLGSGVSASAPRPTQIIVIVPGCVVDPADVIGWWRGNGDLTAAIGPDLTGTATFAPGIIGQGISLDGTEMLAVDAFPAVSTGVTVESWIKPTPTGNIQTIFSRWDFPSTDDSARSYALFLDPSGGLLWSTDDTSTRRPQELSAEAPQLFNGRFHHVAATWNRTEMAIYVDGNLAMSGPSQGTLNSAATTEFRLGSKSGIGIPFAFAGVLDEPSVIGRALSATEISELVDAGPNAKCLPDPVVTAGASGAPPGATARWKGANTGAEIFVGPMNSPSATPRSEANHSWTPGTTFDVTMTNNAAADSLTATATGATTTTSTYDFATQGAAGCPSASWNMLDVLVVDGRTEAGLRFADVTIGGDAIGDFGTIDVAGAPGAQAWHVTGVDLDGEFALSGRIEVDGTGFVGNESMRVQVTAGCLAP